MRLSPYFTSNRFSSCRGTTSATSPSAASPTASNRNSRSSGVVFAPPLASRATSHASFKATPAPESSPNGYSLPGSRGWTSAAAAGRTGVPSSVVRISWWSVTINSSPAAFASSASSTLAIPQSTDTTTDTPFAASSRSRAELRP